MKFANEWKVDAVVNSTSSSLCTPSFSMKGYDRAVVITQYTAAGVAPDSSGATAVGIDVKVYAGVASAAPTTAAMSALSSATGSICLSASAGSVTAAEVYVIAAGTLASGLSLTLDGATYTLQGAATLADKAPIKGTGVEVCSALATCIGYNSTKYDLTVSGAGSAGQLLIRRKTSIADDTTWIVASVTAQTTADHWMLIPRRAQNVIEFTAADLRATNSSYTNFMVNAQEGNVSGKPLCITVLRHANQQPAYQTYSYKQLTS